ncbi:hypothetical protein ENE74_06235 [Sphingobium algorifonticola]|uniref:Uncharacterized protein n=2 Tax=Sphingobium algorifonticola TaxID=2008318 RepID=A0A437JA80_9SPHN|nr:hypothetical protein ENE74_06235 [Sphingobium algorifonticola]
MPPPTDISDPDNSEQRDDGQAQDVAADALHRGTEPGGETERGGGDDRGAVMPDDTPDLVDTMNAMVRSGRIDNGAFAGEPMMDDEEDILGDTDDDEDD